MRIVGVWLAVSLMLSIVLGGCSGGGGGQTVGSRGDVEMHVTWPRTVSRADERYIPGATKSLVVTIDNGSGHTKTQTVSRPVDNTPSTVTFTEVPTGDVAITVAAKPQADGSGATLANATAVARIRNREKTRVTLDLDSTVTEVTIDEAPSDMHTTETAQLIASARNADGAIIPVLPQPEGFYWASSAPAVAEIDQQGVLTALTAGTTTISAMERESGVTGTVDLRIEPANGTLEIIVLTGEIDVAVAPAAIGLVTGGITTFTAVVEGVPNQSVLWSVQEADGGTITADGFYTAPATPGTYHVVATSIADTTQTGTATVTVRQSRIIFSKSDGQEVVNYDLYAINPDGTNLVRLTTHYNADAYPSLSSDGSVITWATKRDGHFAIFTMNSDGTNLTRLTDGATYNYQPSISPDGSKIVFYSDREFTHDLYIMNSDGSNQTALTRGESFEYYPCFTADGEHVVYISSETGNAEVCMINIDGTGAVNLTNNPADDGVPACSPDGRHIVFESFRDGNSNLYVMDIDGSNVRQITNDAYYETEPCFSPDGRQIVFSSNQTADGNDELFIIDIDGSNLRQLTDVVDGTAIMPTWWL